MARLRIAIAKPDSGVIGGFERVVQRVGRWLRAQGHVVEVAAVRVDTTPDAGLGIVPTKKLERAAPAYVNHMALLGAFARLDLSAADLVISTQPPSQGVRHPRHLALFYHHDRAFYDLRDRMIRSGRVDDAELHLELSSLVQAADRPGLDGVRQFLVPSNTVRERLRRFNGIHQAIPFHAGLSHRPDRPDGPELPAASQRRHVLCVSRHEFPKRTELFVAAAHQAPELEAVCVGAGALLPHVQTLDRHLDRGESVDPEDLWCRPAGWPMPRLGQPGTGHVRFHTHVLGAELDELYREARCVVAPALDEDYGLTAIEAMSWGVPLVVCEDGGGLAEIVRETGTGLVVPADHKEIADAVRRIWYSPELANRFGNAGRQAVRHRFTWPRAFDQLQTAIDRVMGGR